MKILVADKISDSCLDALRGLGCEIATALDARADELAAHLKGVGILIVRSKKVLPETLSRSDALQLIIRAGAGVDNIAVEDASARGVFVTNCPGRNSLAVAELTIGLIIALDRRIVENTLDLRHGRWNKREYAKARGLAGRTLGIIGLGQIGLSVAQRAAALGMKIAAWSRSLTPQRAADLGVAFCNWPREVARAADVVTLHVGDTLETRHLVDAEFLSNMKKGACLINTARGGVVDEAALAVAVRERGIRVALDVYEDEPSVPEGAYKNALLALPNVIGTHHIGASTDQAQEAIADEVVRIVQRFLAAGEVLNCVNVAERSPAKWQLVVRHYDRVGVLAGILEAVRADRINAQEITNRIFSGARAACASIMLDDRPSDAAMDAIRANRDVIQAEIRAVV